MVVLKKMAPLVTFSPANREAVSKTNTQDDTIAVSPRRGMPELLLALLQGRAPTDRLIPLSLADIKIFLAPVAPKGFTPHMLRHGGASLAGLSAVPLNEIMTRGRWAVPSSAQRYTKP